MDFGAGDIGGLKSMCARMSRSLSMPGARGAEEREIKIACPLLVLWGERGSTGRWYDPLAIWCSYGTGPVTGAAVPAGHYIAESARGDVGLVRPILRLSRPRPSAFAPDP